MSSFALTQIHLEEKFRHEETTRKRPRDHWCFTVRGFSKT